MTTKTDQITIIRDFLSLPAEAIPAATLIDSLDEHCNAWQLLRAYLADPEWGFGERIRLTADRDGWREGVYVDV